MLNGRGRKLVGQFRQEHFAGLPILAEDPDLDQSVRLQCPVDLLLDGAGQAFAADHDHRIEVVGGRAVFLALSGGQVDLRHGAIIDPGPRSRRGLTIGPMKVRTQSKKVNKAWLNQHVNDPYVKLAQKEGYRARAAYKLKEIDETLGLVRPGDRVADLGSAPGAWSQYLRRRLIGPTGGELSGRIVAVDLLPMEPIEGVTFIQGDLREQPVLLQLEQAVRGAAGDAKLDLVVCDMAPNLSGIASADAARLVHLVELAVEFAGAQLKPDGALVAKAFHGGGYDELVRLFQARFRAVKKIKPKASRPQSAETFLVGLGLKAQA